MRPQRPGLVPRAAERLGPDDRWGGGWRGVRRAGRQRQHRGPRLPGREASLGFYLDPNGPGGVTNAPQPECFFANRLFNDAGPDGSGALHSPTGGDVQAVVYDVSAWTQPHTWLVCFEDLDSGPLPGTSTDNDFNDLVFEVQAMSVTPVVTVTFGALKARYR